jgi:hypothetical protein
LSSKWRTIAAFTIFSRDFRGSRSQLPPYIFLAYSWYSFSTFLYLNQVKLNKIYIDEIAARTARISGQESSTSAEFSIVEGTPGWVPVEVNGHYRIVPEDFVFPV